MVIASAFVQRFKAGSVQYISLFHSNQPVTLHRLFSGIKVSGIKFVLWYQICLYIIFTIWKLHNSDYNMIWINPFMEYVVVFLTLLINIAFFKLHILVSNLSYMQLFTTWDITDMTGCKGTSSRNILRKFLTFNSFFFQVNNEYRHILLPMVICIIEKYHETLLDYLSSGYTFVHDRLWHLAHIWFIAYFNPRKCWFSICTEAKHLLCPHMSQHVMVLHHQQAQCW